MNKDLIIPCPACKKSQQWTDCNEYKPFCCNRCQLIDLGEWANETHAIPGERVMLPDPDNITLSPGIA